MAPREDWLVLSLQCPTQRQLSRSSSRSRRGRRWCLSFPCLLGKGSRVLGGGGLVDSSLEKHSGEGWRSGCCRRSGRLLSATLLGTSFAISGVLGGSLFSQSWGESSLVVPVEYLYRSLGREHCSPALAVSLAASPR